MVRLFALAGCAGTGSPEVDPELLARLAVLDANLAAAEATAARQDAQIGALELELARAREDITCDEWLRSVMVLEDDTVTFTGVNIRIESGDPDGLPNGLGNLIVGGNESDGTEVRTGSHNLVVGPYHSYSGQYSVLSGHQNGVNADNAVALGGRGNRVTGEAGVVVGGQDGEAGHWGVVIGGDGNRADFGVAIGGTELLACGAGSVAIGGSGGEARGAGSLVVGGEGLMAWGYAAAAIGGAYNTAAGEFSLLVGGQGNSTDANTYFASVVGGEGNRVRGAKDAPFYGTIVGGTSGAIGVAGGAEGLGDGDCVTGGTSGGTVRGPDANSSNAQYATLLGPNGQDVTSGWYAVERGGD